MKNHPKVSYQTIENAPIKGEWVVPKEGPTETTILFLHGGGHVMGTLFGYREFLSYFALQARARILSLDYRLSPEHPFPASSEDAFTAYRWLLDNKVDPAHLVVSGDSAGGGLTLALLQLIRKEQLPQPAAAICLCPWVDLSEEAPYDKEVLNRDKMLDLQSGEKFRGMYAGNNDLHNPLISPIYADLTGLAPIFIQVGTNDSLITQNLKFEKLARQQNADVTLDVWDDMPHDWQVFLIRTAEAKAAIAKVCDFIQAKAPQAVNF